MQREAAREPCTDSAHPTGPAISIREHHIVSPATPLHTSLCDWEQKQLTENWQAMCCPPYLRKCTSCHPGDSCSGSLQSFSEFQFSYGYVSLIRGSNNEVQCKTAIEPKYGLLGLWPPKPTRVSNRQWHETPVLAGGVYHGLSDDQRGLERGHRALGIWDWEQRIILCYH